jgi:tRNA(His) guanylyltransferase
MSEGALGTRMKEYYENRYRIHLTRRTPVILRLDGKSFHSLTKDCVKPYDYVFIRNMVETMFYLCSNIQGCKLGYHQSDEISLLLTDFDRLDTDAWFDYNLQKMVSAAAGMASMYLSESLTKEDNYNFKQVDGSVRAVFDCRAFNVPKEEVTNYFIWRQKDWNRNSVLMLAQYFFSHKEMHGKNIPELHEMLYSKGINWADNPDFIKNGTFAAYCDEADKCWMPFSPILTENRDIVERLLIPLEE